MIDKSLQKLLKRPSFTAQDARQLGIHPSRLAYYAKQGLIERVSRGVYQNPAQSNSEIIPIDLEELLITAQSIPNGVICLISALSYYGLTDEIPRQHWIAVQHETKAPVRRHAKIVRLRNIELGRQRLQIGGFHTSIFDRERTVVDSFKHLSIETALKALRIYLKTTKEQKPDINKLARYAKTLRAPAINDYIVAMTTT